MDTYDIIREYNYEKLEFEDIDPENPYVNISPGGVISEWSFEWSNPHLGERKMEFNPGYNEWEHSERVEAGPDERYREVTYCFRYSRGRVLYYIQTYAPRFDGSEYNNWEYPNFTITNVYIKSKVSSLPIGNYNIIDYKIKWEDDYSNFYQWNKEQRLKDVKFFGLGDDKDEENSTKIDTYCIRQNLDVFKDREGGQIFTKCDRFQIPLYFIDDKKMMGFGMYTKDTEVDGYRFKKLPSGGVLNSTNQKTFGFSDSLPSDFSEKFEKQELYIIGDGIYDKYHYGIGGQVFDYPRDNYKPDDYTALPKFWGIYSNQYVVTKIYEKNNPDIFTYINLSTDRGSNYETITLNGKIITIASWKTSDYYYGLKIGMQCNLDSVIDNFYLPSQDDEGQPVYTYSISLNPSVEVILTHTYSAGYTTDQHFDKSAGYSHVINMLDASGKKSYPVTVTAVRNYKDEITELEFYRQESPSFLSYDFTVRSYQKPDREYGFEFYPYLNPETYSDSE